MSFKDLNLAIEYRSLNDNVIRDFYAPVLSQSVCYQRAVGFFSSSSLIKLTDGLRGLIENNGKIEIIASPRLSEKDLEAINYGLVNKEKIIFDALERELKEPKGPFEEARLNLLANLISSNILNIKIAFLDTGSEIGMFHEKLGIMYDASGDYIAFDGSMNESAFAFSVNYESINVYKSWEDELDRAATKRAAFNAMWGDYEPSISVMSFDKIEKRFIEKYKTTDEICFEEIVPIKDTEVNESIEDLPSNKEDLPRIPATVELRPYQIEGIANWVNASYRGIFDMATGTGKTYTALSAIVKLSESKEDKLCIVIVCPYQHLVEQWNIDALAFGLKPTLCYSKSKQRDWKSRVLRDLKNFNRGFIDNVTIITTNATFSSDFIQNELSKISGSCLIVVDEAHNFGTEKLIKALPQNFPYRLALSATIERYNDEEGTEAIFEYFGDKCLTYTLRDAIFNGYLTPYRYYPIVVSLNERELEEYLDYTHEISRAVASSETKKGKLHLSEYAKILLIKRARIVAGAEEKVHKLSEIIKPMNHTLVYCGATTASDPDFMENESDESEIRQIDSVVVALRKKGLKVHKFTAEESPEQRVMLQQEFVDGTHLQALIAIRCLDEGVNIPSIETAYILASSTNPKEYIQRRGRVLRTSPGKKEAVIYDFITLPIPFELLGRYNSDIINSCKSLAIRELIRMKDFARLSENPSEADELANRMIESFGIINREEMENLYEKL